MGLNELVEDMESHLNGQKTPLSVRKVDDLEPVYLEPEYLNAQQYALDVLNKLRVLVSQQKERRDYQEFYRASDDIYAESGQTGNSNRPSWSDLEALANERCGFGWYLTKGLAGDVVRNGFEFVNYEGRVVPKPQIYKWCVKSDFNNQLEELVRYERIYGTSFLLKYYSKNDNYKTPPPRKPPISFQAFPPTVLTPTNLTDTNMLDYDQEVWEFMGGTTNHVEIHKDRIHVLCTRPQPYDWQGLSIFEPIFLSASGYLNLVINGVKMMAKYGNVVTSFTMNEENPTIEMYQEYEELINSFKAAYTFILGKGEEINFQDTKISNGLAELAEFLKEDISSGSGVPLNQLFGRAVSGGIGGAGALTAERGKIQTISNIQHNIADDVWKIMRSCGWNVEGLLVRFRLDLQKTEMAKLEERNLELQNYILEEQLKQLQLNTMMQAQQMQMMMTNPEAFLPEQVTQAEGQAQLPDKRGGNPADQTRHAMGGGRQNASKGQEKAALTGMMRRNQDFLIRNAETYEAILKQYKIKKEMEGN